MKIIYHIVFFLCVSTMVLAQSYDALWKQYRGFADKDQPKSALVILEKIKTKAEKEKSYGNLLAALMREVRHQREISNDSGKVYRERLDKRIAASDDGVMKTLYRMAKGDRVDVDSLLKSPDSAIYRRQDASLQWVPFLEKGKDSKVFNNDLLHVIILYGYPFKRDEKLDSINMVYTEQLNYVNFRDTLIANCELNKMKGVKMVPDHVKVTFFTDVLTEERIEGIPVIGINMPEGLQLRTFPAKVTVSFVTGVSTYRQLKQEDFTVIADYNEIRKNPSEKCHIYLKEVPRGISKAKLEISSVDYLIESEAK